MIIVECDFFSFHRQHRDFPFLMLPLASFPPLPLMQRWSTLSPSPQPALWVLQSWTLQLPLSFWSHSLFPSSHLPTGSLPSCQYVQVLIPTLLPSPRQQPSLLLPVPSFPHLGIYTCAYHYVMKHQEQGFVLRRSRLHSSPLTRSTTFREQVTSFQVNFLLHETRLIISAPPPSQLYCEDQVR